MLRHPAPLSALLAITLAVPASAQLRLRDALRLADHDAFANRIAAGNVAAQHAQTIAPLRGILPTMRFESGFVRTTDPVATFGSTLRQRTITPTDFDPTRLNYPAPVSNYQAGAVVEQPIFNADAWAGRAAAERAATGTADSQRWTTLSTHADVLRAYYGAILAGERVATLEAASRAAHSHVSQAETMVRNGLATKSDALLAEVRAGDMDTQLAEARGAAETAGRQLELLLGGDPSTPASLPTALPPTASIRQLAEGDTGVSAGAPRADVLAARHGLDAATSDLTRARAAYLPRVNAFARYDWNSAARLYAGDKNWTVGVMASWSPFAGASELSDIEGAEGRRASARAGADAAAARAQLEVEQTRTALLVALQRLDIAERAVAQSQEAHRIVAKKYDGGLASVTELLDAQAAETQSTLALSQARYAVITASADRRLALGADPATLATLDDASPITAAASTAVTR